MLTEAAESFVPSIGLKEAWGAGFGGHLDGRLSGARRQPGPLKQRWTISDFVEAYTKGLTTPAEVAERIIALIWEQDSCAPPMRMMLAHLPHHLRQHAAASTERCVSSGLAQLLVQHTGYFTSLSSKQRVSSCPARQPLSLQRRGHSTSLNRKQRNYAAAAMILMDMIYHLSNEQLHSIVWRCT